jgi:hypothetical protein
MTSNAYIASQVMTFAIPVGMLFLVILVGYFARYRQH